MLRSRSRLYLIFPHIRTPLRSDNEHRVMRTPSPDRSEGPGSRRVPAGAISRKGARRRTGTLSPAQSAL